MEITSCWGPPGKMTSEHRTQIPAVCGTLLYSQHDEWCQLCMCGGGVLCLAPLLGFFYKFVYNLNIVLRPFSMECN